MQENYEKDLELIENSGFSKSSVIGNAISILSKQIIEEVERAFVSGIKGDSITSFSLIFKEIIPEKDFRDKIARIQDSIEKTIGAKSNVSEYGFKNLYSDRNPELDPQITIYLPNEEKKEFLLKNISKNNPTLVEESILFSKSLSFKEAQDSYEIFGGREYSEPLSLYSTIEENLRLSGKELKDLDSGKTNEEIKQILQEKFDNYYTEGSREIFNLLKTEWRQHRDEKPEEALINLINSYSKGMRKVSMWDMFDREEKLDFSILDPEGKRTSEEMAEEVNKAVAIWNARSVFNQVVSSYFTIFSDNYVESISAAKEAIDKYLKKAEVGYEIFDKEGKKSHEEMKNKVMDQFASIEEGLIEASKERAYQYFNMLKENEQDNPDKIIESIKKELMKANIKIEELGTEYQDELDHYRKLSQVRILYNAILNDVEGLDKKGSFKFIKDTLSELGEDYKSLDPRSNWNAEEIEKELITRAYSNPSIEGPNKKGGV